MEFAQFVESAVARIRDTTLRFNPENWLDTELNEVMLNYRLERDKEVRELVEVWTESAKGIVSSHEGVYTGINVMNMKSKLVDSFSFSQAVYEKVAVPDASRLPSMWCVDVEKENQSTANSIVILYNQYASIIRKYHALIVDAVRSIDKTAAIYQLIPDTERHKYSQLPSEAVTEYAYDILCAEKSLDREGLLSDLVLILRSSYVENGAEIVITPASKEYLALVYNPSTGNILLRINGKELSTGQITLNYPECLMYKYTLQAIIEKNTKVV